MKRQLLVLSVLLLTATSFAQVAPPAAGDTKEPQPQPEPQPPATPKRARIFGGDVDTQRAMADRERAQAERAKAEADLVYTRNAFATWKQKLEKGSYLGVATSPLPSVVRDQLKLEKGVGIVVDRVDAESPAEAAGIKTSDIIQKLDDQFLINPHQFGVLVRTLKPGVEAKLTIIRETKPQTIAVKPIEKDLAPVDEPITGYGMARPWGETANATLTPTMPRNGRITVTAPGGNDVTRAEIFTVNNDKMNITTTTDGRGQRHVTALDAATGKVLYDNVIDNDAQLKDMPPEVADQLKAVEKIATKQPYRVRGNLIGGGAVNFIRAANNLPKVKAVSGSDDDYTWDFTTKTNENGKAELQLLLLDKNGTKVFDEAFSRTRDMDKLPKQVQERFSSYPWDLMIEDLKSGGGNNAGINAFAPQPVGVAPAPVAPQPKLPGLQAK